MIHIVFDTNIWFYLSNGFNLVTNDYESVSSVHIDTFNKIKAKALSGDFNILTNDIIISEWYRNKKATKSGLKKISILKKAEIERILATSGKSNKNEVIEKLDSINKDFQNLIKRNEDHIDTVEQFILSRKRISVSDQTKIEIFNLAAEKRKSPFRSSKNNIADAAILFSAVEYLRENFSEYNDRAVFVSANHTEFSDPKERSRFHPDLREKIGLMALEYHDNPFSLLELTEELEEEIEYFRRYALDFNNTFSCQAFDCGEIFDYQTSGDLLEKIRIASNYDLVDPNQLTLFNNSVPRTPNKEDIVRTGVCNSCGTTHVECPNCYSVIPDINGDFQFFCRDCEQGFQLSISPRDGQSIIREIDESDFHL